MGRQAPVAKRGQEWLVNLEVRALGRTCFFFQEGNIFPDGNRAQDFQGRVGLGQIQDIAGVALQVRQVVGDAEYRF